MKTFIVIWTSLLLFPFQTCPNISCDIKYLILCYSNNHSFSHSLLKRDTFAFDNLLIHDVSKTRKQAENIIKNVVIYFYIWVNLVWRVVYASVLFMCSPLVVSSVIVLTSYNVYCILMVFYTLLIIPLLLAMLWATVFFLLLLYLYQILIGQYKAYCLWSKNILSKKTATNNPIAQ